MLAQAPAQTVQVDTEGEGGAAPETSDEDDTIVVFGRRMVGELDVPQPPLLELEEQDIAAYGAGSIAELIEALAPQVSSSRGRGGGRPVMLVNGLRISSFRELRSYPPEAIQKVEVFPEEVAQRYGYPADQRVVNFILKDNFSSREIELEYGQPWEGGNSTQQVEGTYLLIKGPSRLNFNLEWDNSSLLTEADRGVIQANPPTYPGVDPDPARYRSLVSDSSSLEATANWTTRLGDTGNSLSLNGTFERADTLRFQGLDSVLLTDVAGNTALRTFNTDDPLTVDARTDTYSFGSTLNLNAGEWELTGTVDASHAETTSRVERRLTAANSPEYAQVIADAAAGTLALDGDLGSFADAGYDEARSKTDRAAALVTARSTPVYLPAGDLSVTLDGGYDWQRIRSRDTRNSGLETDLDRGDITAGVNLGIPLTSRDADVLGAVGDVALTLSAGIDELSDFGTLYDWSAGVNWGLTDTLSFSATYINRDSAPTLAQLGDPEIATDNVSVYDFTTSQTVLVTTVSGGNPTLPAQSQGDWKFGFAWQLPILDRSNFYVDYIRNRSRDVASSFPVLTPEVEAAYPDRVVRDGAGNLVQIDQRPVSFAEQNIDRMVFGLNLSGQLGGSDEEAASGRGSGRSAPTGGVAMAGDAPARTRSGPGDFDPNRFAAMRTLLCGDEGADIARRLARGETVTRPGGEAVTQPPMMLERLRADGEPSDEQIEQFRQRICSSDGPPGGRGQFAMAGGGGAGGQAQGGGQSGAQGQGEGQPQPQGGANGGPPAGRSGGPGGGGGRGPRMPGFGPPGGGGGRWFMNLDYTLDLKNEVLVAAGGPLLDLLDGDALTGGGNPRHTVNLRVGAFMNGFGGFLTGTYAGTSRVDGTGAPGSTDLRFGDLATFDIRMFVDLGAQQKLVTKVPFLDKTRISFDVENIFDARQRVTDSSGVVPISYQPYLLDPVGRSFEIELRKLF